MVSGDGHAGGRGVSGDGHAGGRGVHGDGRASGRGVHGDGRASGRGVSGDGHAGALGRRAELMTIAVCAVVSVVGCVFGLNMVRGSIVALRKWTGGDTFS